MNNKIVTCSTLADVDFALAKDNQACELIQVCYNLDNPLTYEREINSLHKPNEELN